MWGLGRWVGAMVVVAVLFSGTWLYAQHWRPDRREYLMQGVDINAATGTVDWGMAKARDVSFAYLLATSGDRGRDAAFEQYWSALAGSGIRRGAIHAFSLCRLAADQADHFNAVVPRADDALPAVVSFEFSANCSDRPSRDVVIREVSTFLERVERHTGGHVLLRIGPAFEEQYRLSAGIDRNLWATGNFMAPEYLSRPWRMWQANDARRVDGFEGPVGWNVVAQ